jgi:hypothetical protein
MVKTRTRVAAAIVATVVAGVGGGVAETLLAPSAQATLSYIGKPDDWSADNFRDELRYTGLSHEDSDNAFSLGMRVCGQRSRGWSSSEIEDSFIMDPYYTTEQAIKIVRGAEWHFCSGYAND